MDKVIGLHVSFFDKLGEGGVSVYRWKFRESKGLSYLISFLSLTGLFFNCRVSMGIRSE
jgi:hypothetical protein